jgi:tRNA A-37 threonylcarbamoyl transferase component Bud32
VLRFGAMAGRKLCPSCSERYPAEILFCPRDGSPLVTRPADAAADPFIGRAVGTVRLEQLVGVGSMARVYRSTQADVERDVAVKVLRPDLMADGALVARFWREAKVAGRLAHPGIVSVLSVGALPESGEPYLVMEYLDGLTLRSLLAASTEPLALGRALHLVLQATDAMAEAHAKGVIHRDLKPENLMLVRRGQDPDFVKVLDFGIAHATWIQDDAATRAGAVLGTADYLSPEAARGLPASPRSDVYSLASIAFECLMGRRTHPGRGPVDVLVRKATEDAPDAGTLSEGRVPPAIAAWLRKNLARNPEDRDRDAREAGQSLLDAALSAGCSIEELGIGATLVGARPGGGTRALTFSAEMRARMDPAPRGRPGPAGLVAGLLATGALCVAQAGHAQEAFTHDPAPERDDTGQTYGMAEVGLGLLTLPTAQVCIERAEAGCSRGDRSLLLSGWPIFRRDQLALGAGVGFGLSPSADAPQSTEVSIPRDHHRSYFTLEVTARYYVPLNAGLDGWLGLTTGLVVVNDTFRPLEGRTEQALVGPRGVTLLTEGGTLGIAGGMTAMLSPSLLVGGHVRGSNWFLPQEPATNALGDEASLQGNVLALELSVTLAYRSRLVF